MRRLVGFAFDYEEPVRGGYLRLGDVTVLTGRNDTGKTRLLGLIESALVDPGSVQGVDVFGLASEGEVDDLIDRGAPGRGSIGECAEALGSLADALEIDEGEEVRVGVRLHHGGGASAWRFGRAPVELDSPAGEEVMDLLRQAV